MSPTRTRASRLRTAPLPRDAIEGDAPDLSLSLALRAGLPWAFLGEAPRRADGGRAQRVAHRLHLLRAEAAAGQEQQVEAARQLRAGRPERFAQEAPQAVSRDRVSPPLGDDEAVARRPAVGAVECVDDDGAGRGRASVIEDAADVAAPRDARAARQAHRAGARR